MLIGLYLDNCCWCLMSHQHYNRGFAQHQIGGHGQGHLDGNRILMLLWLCKQFFLMWLPLQQMETNVHGSSDKIQWHFLALLRLASLGATCNQLLSMEVKHKKEIKVVPPFTFTFFFLRRTLLCTCSCGGSSSRSSPSGIHLQSTQVQ